MGDCILGSRSDSHCRQFLESVMFHKDDVLAQNRLHPLIPNHLDQDLDLPWGHRLSYQVYLQYQSHNRTHNRHLKYRLPKLTISCVIYPRYIPSTYIVCRSLPHNTWPKMVIIKIFFILIFFCIIYQRKPFISSLSFITRRILILITSCDSNRTWTSTMI